MERHLGRRLNRDEAVHHIDGNRDNNDIDNLRLMTNSEHAKLHYQQGDYNSLLNGATFFKQGNIPVNRSITEEIALKIYNAVKNNVPRKDIMAQFNVNRYLISDIMRGRSFSRVTGIKDHATVNRRARGGRDANDD